MKSFLHQARNRIGSDSPAPKLPGEANRQKSEAHRRHTNCILACLAPCVQEHAHFCVSKVLNYTGSTFVPRRWEGQIQQCVLKYNAQKDRCKKSMLRSRTSECQLWKILFRIRACAEDGGVRWEAGMREKSRWRCCGKEWRTKEMGRGEKIGTNMGGSCKMYMSSPPNTQTVQAIVMYIYNLWCNSLCTASFILDGKLPAIPVCAGE